MAVVIVGIKIVLAAVIFCFGFLGGMLPYWRSAEEERPKFLDYGNAFAAGIFLGLGLLFMLQNSNDHFERLVPGVRYPIAGALAMTSFLLLMLIEHVLPTRRADHMVHVEIAEGTADVVQADKSSFAPMMLLGALGFGSFIAGLALGAQLHLKNMMLIFIAIIAHKGTAGFALGVSMRLGGLPQVLGRKLIMLFALTTPTGILVGMLVGGLMAGRGEQLFATTSTALLAGVFLYVATLDILREQLSEGSGHLARWLILAASMAMMLVLAIWL